MDLVKYIEQFKDMTHADIADAINAQQDTSAKSIIKNTEIYDLLDPNEAKLMGDGMWQLLRQPEFQIPSNTFNLLLSLCPSNSQKLIQDFINKPVVIPMYEALGFTRELDYGDIAVIKGFEPDLIDIETNEGQNISGMRSAELTKMKTEIQAKNDAVTEHIAASPVLMRSL